MRVIGSVRVQLSCSNVRDSTEGRWIPRTGRNTGVDIWTHPRDELLHWQGLGLRKGGRRVGGRRSHTPVRTGWRTTDIVQEPCAASYAGMTRTRMNTTRPTLCLRL